MADVELVIKISEKVYNALTHIEFDANLVTDEMRKSIANGTPLPKGHGKLMDADAFANFLKNISKTQRYNEFIIDKQLTGVTVDDVFNVICESLQDENSVPTIIDADSEE